MYLNMNLLLTIVTFVVAANSFAIDIPETEDVFQDIKQEYEAALQNIPKELQEDAKLLVVS